MKVLELLEELEDIVDTSAGVPLTGKILVDAEEILEIIKEIRVELPDEIKQAVWIKEERQRIINEAHHESEKLITEARAEAEALVENDDIVNKARHKAEDIIKYADSSAKNVKVDTYEYLEGMLSNFQQSVAEMNQTYLQEMYERLQQSLTSIHRTIDDNRNQLKEMAFKARNMELDDIPTLPQRAPVEYEEEDYEQE